MSRLLFALCSAIRRSSSRLVISSRSKKIIHTAGRIERRCRERQRSLGPNEWKMLCKTNERELLCKRTRPDDAPNLGPACMTTKTITKSGLYIYIFICSHISIRIYIYIYVYFIYMITFIPSYIVLYRWLHSTANTHDFVPLRRHEFVKAATFSALRLNWLFGSRLARAGLYFYRFCTDVRSHILLILA